MNYDFKFAQVLIVALHRKTALTFIWEAFNFANVDGRKGWPKLKLGQSEVGRVISSIGVTQRATGPEKTDGSARGSWGSELRKQRSHQGPWWCMPPRCFAPSQEPAA